MTSKITLPNGAVLNGIPDGTSRRDIAAFAIKNGMATEADFPEFAAKPETQLEPEQPTGASPRMQRANQARSEKIEAVEEYLSTLPAEERDRLESMGYGSRFLRGAREGVETFVRGAGSLIGMDTERSPEEKAELERIQRSGVDGAYKLGEFSGKMLPSMAIGGGVGAATRGVNAGWQGFAQAVGGAAEGAAMAKGEGASPLTGAALGAIGGAAGSMAVPAAQFAGRQIRRAGARTARHAADRAAPLIDPRTGQVTPEFEAALKSEGLTPDSLSPETMQGLTRLSGDSLPPEQAARYALFESQGVTPTRAQITRDIDDALNEAELSKVNSGLTGRLDEQSETIQNAFEQRIRDMGGSQREDAYVHDVVTARDDMLRDATKAAYREAAEDAAQQGVSVRPDNLLEEIKKASGYSKDRRATAESIKQELEGLGILNKDGEISGRIRADYAETLRQTMNQFMKENYQEGSKIQNPVTQALIKAYDDDLARDMNTEAYKIARSNAKKHFDSMKAFTRTTGKEKKKSLVSEILDDKIPPDELVNKAVFSKSYDDTQLKSLRGFMEGQGQAGKEAFDSLRADALQELFDKSSLVNKTTGEFSRMSANKFSRNLKQIGDRKLKELFTPEEVKFLKQNARLLEKFNMPSGVGRGLGGVSNTIKALENMARKTAGTAGDYTAELGRLVRSSNEDKLALSVALRDLSGSQDKITSKARPVAKGIGSGVGAVAAQSVQQRD